MWRSPRCWFWRTARPLEALPRRPAAPRFRCLRPAAVRVPPGARWAPRVVRVVPWAVRKVRWVPPGVRWVPWAVRGVRWAARWVLPAVLGARWVPPGVLGARWAVQWVPPAVRWAPWALPGVRWAPWAVRGVRWDRKAALKVQWVPWEAPAVRPVGLQARPVVPEVNRPVPRELAVVSEAARAASQAAGEVPAVRRARATLRESCVNPWRVTTAKLPVSAAPWRRPDRDPPPVPEALAE